MDADELLADVMLTERLRSVVEKVGRDSFPNMKSRPRMLSPTSIAKGLPKPCGRAVGLNTYDYSVSNIFLFRLYIYIIIIYFFAVYGWSQSEYAQLTIRFHVFSSRPSVAYPAFDPAETSKKNQQLLNEQTFLGRADEMKWCALDVSFGAVRKGMVEV